MAGCVAASSFEDRFLERELSFDRILGTVNHGGASGKAWEAGQLQLHVRLARAATDQMDFAVTTCQETLDFQKYQSRFFPNSGNSTHRIGQTCSNKARNPSFNKQSSEGPQAGKAGKSRPVA